MGVTPHQYPPALSSERSYLHVPRPGVHVQYLLPSRPGVHMQYLPVLISPTYMYMYMLDLSLHLHVHGPVSSSSYLSCLASLDTHLGDLHVLWGGFSVLSAGVVGAGPDAVQGYLRRCPGPLVDGQHGWRLSVTGRGGLQHFNTPGRGEGKESICIIMNSCVHVYIIS